MVGDKRMSIMVRKCMFSKARGQSISQHGVDLTAVVTCYTDTACFVQVQREKSFLALHGVGTWTDCCMTCVTALGMGRGAFCFPALVLAFVSERIGGG